MCLILFAYNIHPDYRLVVLSNRDEFYERKTAPAAWWKNYPEILAGKDLKAGGTWMGISASGRFSALTNFRDPHNILVDAPSRGDLVVDFLKGEMNSGEYMETLQPDAHLYNGYNLLADDGNDLYHFSNQDPKLNQLSPGIYGLSNALLDTPWPKVENGKAALAELVSADRLDIEKAFSILGDTRKAPDEVLPDTGVPLEWERRLSSIHIASEVYGTRCSTVFTQDQKGRITYEERTFIPKEGIETFDFEVKGLKKDMK